MRIFGLRSCDSCRRAVKALAAAGVDADLIDIREAPIDEAVLDRALEQYGEALVNRRSTTWRALGQEERARPARELLRAHPALMKRPLIETDDGRLLLGWTPETQAALGLA
ncbi:arsenate reductase [Meinhardsimonia xiamenensis]|uniref:Arsenate reductase n=1 Tax=Meinhardsimonia xiamenensis TaxID=990712 RepID=A0A1G9AZD4_9RHOB|nr:ArsC/Spx/MgsR family protein [Meinhardsimonia xiamenensis]PRX35190.1 arsenate reductase [Meinhardsimonia xiamenensis]SDK32558.1 arsenate reductase [Meinhardsimonia xiamenensis]